MLRKMLEESQYAHIWVPTFLTKSGASKLPGIVNSWGLQQLGRALLMQLDQSNIEPASYTVAVEDLWIGFFLQGYSAPTPVQ